MLTRTSVHRALGTSSQSKPGPSSPCLHDGFFMGKGRHGRRSNPSVTLQCQELRRPFQDVQGQRVIYSPVLSGHDWKLLNPPFASRPSERKGTLGSTQQFRVGLGRASRSPGILVLHSQHHTSPHSVSVTPDSSVIFSGDYK